MGEDMGVRVSQLRPFAMNLPVQAWDEAEHRHGWRENPESSPQVELKSQFISMGEDMAVRVSQLRPFAMNLPVQAWDEAVHRHGWRENPESSPQVELKSQFISMGEDLAVREARC